MSPPDPAALARYRGFLFDADGTLWHGLQPLPGAAAVVGALKRLGRRVGVVSNNSVLSVETLYARLRALGMPFERDEVTSAPLATALYVAQEKPGARVFDIGSAELREQLLQAGLRIETNPKAIEYLILGLDREINFEKLTIALHAARNGARIVALNQDRVGVDEHGLYPGAGMVVGAVRGMTGRDPDVTIGKPSPLLLEEAAVRLGLRPADCLFAGDYLETDILAANRAGMGSLLVLTGVSKEADVERSAATPDFVLPSLLDLLALLNDADPELARREM